MLENPNKIYYEWFVQNEHPLAGVHILENPEKINYDWFSCNEHTLAAAHMR